MENQTLVKEMGEWGFKEAKKYSWSKITDKILDFYRFCWKNKNPT
jgi:glycosyltransferase involved in cell wall biosynthesis